MAAAAVRAHVSLHLGHGGGQLARGRVRDARRLLFLLGLVRTDLIDGRLDVVDHVQKLIASACEHGVRGVQAAKLAHEPQLMSG